MPRHEHDAHAGINPAERKPSCFREEFQESCFFSALPVWAEAGKRAVSAMPSVEVKLEELERLIGGDQDMDPHRYGRVLQNALRAGMTAAEPAAGVPAGLTETQQLDRRATCIMSHCTVFPS